MKHEEIARLKKEIDKLDRPERLELAYYLLVSLDEEMAWIHDAWEKEIARRVEEIRSGKAKTIPGDEVLAKMRKEYP